MKEIKFSEFLQLWFYEEVKKSAFNVLRKKYANHVSKVKNIEIIDYAYFCTDDDKPIVRVHYDVDFKTTGELSPVSESGYLDICESDLLEDDQ